MPGITLYLQPVQDLTIEDRVSRTQFQFIMEDPDANRLSEWVPRLIDRLKQSPELQDVASDLQDRGLQAFLDIDRDAAGRLGISVSAIDDALYDAFGQRLISTIYTQANQYRVVLEAAPQYQIGPEALGQIHVATQTAAAQPTPGGERASASVGGQRVEGRPGAALEHRARRAAAHAARHQSRRPVSGGDVVVQPRTRRLARRRGQRDRGAQREIGMPASIQTRFQGAAEAFRGVARQHAAVDPRGGRDDVHRPRRAVRELHPPDHDSLDAALGGRRRAARAAADRTELSLIAIIGIILLIGIVKKNAIMMIDFALDAERKQGMSPRDAIFQAALLRFRPILMTTLAALFGALPLMFASGSGAELRQPLGLVMVGGLLVSQVLTLFTTPVIYLFFDRLGRADWRSRASPSLSGLSDAPTGAEANP